MLNKKRLCILLLCIMVFWAHARPGAAEQPARRALQTTLQNSRGQTLEINVKDIQIPTQLHRFDLLPNGLKLLSSTKEALFGAEAQDLTEKTEDGRYSFLLPDPQAKPGTLGALATFDYFAGVNSMNYTDYRRNLNGTETDGVNAPNCALTFEQADAKCRAFLEKLGLESPSPIAGKPQATAGKEVKGFYHFEYTPAYDGIPFTRSPAYSGFNTVMFPMASIFISDDGVFSVSGSFQYDRQNVEPIPDFMNLDTLIERLQFYLESGLLEKMAPLPVSSIRLEMTTAEKGDGSLAVRPVWVVQTDPNALRFEWQQTGLFWLNLKIYADDGSIASM